MSTIKRGATIMTNGGNTRVQEPVAELEPQFSSGNAIPTSWTEAREHLATAKVYWLSTVRPDGRPHVTPIAAIWLDDTLYFSTGQTERKAKNLEQNSRIVITTGSQALEGLDVVVEGDAVRVTDESRLRRLAEEYTAKYGQLFGFTVRDGGFSGGHESKNEVLVYELAPTTAFGFGKGTFGKVTFSQTRWRF
jgi:nitroimidazol reductase NimA-like FMN-containing flavoprotein (pyridoxamine 5'-phosphate oxidase superfamily)